MFTIMVVEDDLALQRMMCAFLGLNGYQTIPAANGEEALDAIERVMPDLVIADEVEAVALAGVMGGSKDSKTELTSIISLCSFLNRIKGDTLNPFSLFFEKTVIAALTELDVFVLKTPCFRPQKIFPGTLSNDNIKPPPN